MNYYGECDSPSQGVTKGVPIFSPFFPFPFHQLQTQVEEVLKDGPAITGRSPGPQSLHGAQPLPPAAKPHWAVVSVKNILSLILSTDVLGLSIDIMENNSWITFITCCFCKESPIDLSSMFISLTGL